MVSKKILGFVLIITLMSLYVRAQQVQEPAAAPTEKNQISASVEATTKPEELMIQDEPEPNLPEEDLAAQELVKQLASESEQSLEPDEATAKEATDLAEQDNESARKAEPVAQPVQAVPQAPVVEALAKQPEVSQPPASISDEKKGETRGADVSLTAEEVAKLAREIEPEVALNFNNTSLQNIADEMARIFKVTFLADDVVKTPDSKIPPLTDSKVSFKTNSPLSKKQAWNLFTTFLELAGWALAPTTDPKLYRITLIDTANKLPLPTFINVPLDVLPQNDQRIRYVCFLENCGTEQITDLLNKLKSAKAQIDTFQLLQAIIITDSAYNIRSLLQIIKALDKTTDPQILSVIHLKEADAKETVELIKDFQSKDDTGSYSPWMPQKKENSLFIFSKSVTITAFPRTNALIMVGPRDDVERLKNFIITYLDPDLKEKYTPLHAYQLDYSPAKQMAEILNKVVQFGRKGGGKDVGIGEFGGVRGGLKYFGDIHIEPDEQGNRLLIRCSREDYGYLVKILDELDKEQPQVAIEVMIVSIDTTGLRQWGAQWTSRKNREINAQLSGFFGSGPQTATTGVPQPNSDTLIADLISLAQLPTAGTTLLTLGKESVWAIFGFLNRATKTRLIASPFIITTNKYRATVAIAEERRAQLEAVQGSGGSASLAGFNSVDAKLLVGITPQINDRGIINLDIDVMLEAFTIPTASVNTSTNGPANANKISKTVHTNANVADKEVIVLGGIMQKKSTITKTEFPILSKIPIIGSLFRNDKREASDSMLAVFMSPTIIQKTDKRADEYTQKKVQSTKKFLDMLEDNETNKRDPLHRWFFKPVEQDYAGEIDKLFYKAAKPLKKKDASGQEQVAQQPSQNNIMRSVQAQSAGEVKV